MRLGIAVAPSAPEGYPAIYTSDLHGSIRKACELGYGCIEWHLRKPDLRETEAAGELCERLGMAVTCIGTGMACAFEGLTLIHADRDVRMRAVERLKEFIDMGRELGSAVIVGSMKGIIPAGQESSRYESYCTESLRRVLDYAERRGVAVVIEALNRYETNFLNTARETHEFVTGMGSRLLRTHIDTFHMNIEEADICESIRACADTLGNVHFADSNRRHPGAGHLDFRAILETLDEIGYGGPMSVECLPFPEPDTAAGNTIVHLVGAKAAEREL